ncbi:MAG: hypothetical protein ACRDVL_09360 [Acidimicrobiia bacterium]
MRSLLRFVARAVLLVLLLLTGPLLVAGAVLVPRITNPNYLAGSLIDSGLSRTVRLSLLEGLAANMGPEPDPSLEAELYRALDPHFTQGWFDGQIVALAAEMSRWLAAEEEELPSLALDLEPVKASLRLDEKAMDLVLLLFQAAREDGAFADLGAQVTLEDVWARFPDRVPLLTEDQEEQAITLREVRGRVQTARRLALASPLVPLLEIVLLLLLARGPISRLRWLAACLLIVALPILAVSLLVPGVVTGVGGRVMAGVPAPLDSGVENLVLDLFGLLVPVSAGLSLVGLAGLIGLPLLRRSAGLPLFQVVDQAHRLSEGSSTL